MELPRTHAGRLSIPIVLLASLTMDLTSSNPNRYSANNPSTYGFPSSSLIARSALTRLILVIAILLLGISIYSRVGAQKRNSVFDTRFPNSPSVPKNEPEDIGKLINFKTIDPMGNRCAMVYGGPSLGLDGFLIQDCGGSSWTKKWNYDGGFVKRMSFLSDRNGWFVIGHGLVKIERNDEALQARVVINDPDQNIESVFFVNELYGWICGDDGMISKTDDGGVTWKRQESNTDIRLKEIRFTSSLEGWASGGEYRNGRSRGVLLTTKDGGANWGVQEAREAKELSPVFFTSPHHGCGVNENNSIFCTNDGETWEIADPDKGGRKIKTAIFFASKKHGWIVGEGIWHTSDGGATWRQQLSIPTTSHELRSVLFLDDQLGWAQSLDAVWRTVDGGKTWVKVSDTWMKRLNTKASDVSARRFDLRPLTPESQSGNRRSPVGFLDPESVAPANQMLTGQKPMKCKHEASEKPPSYRVGWTTYSVEAPRTLFLAISIDPRGFSSTELAALARAVKADYCKERRLVVSILDNYDAARAFAPTNEKAWFQRYWRGVYFLDLTSGEEWIEFSTTPDRPRNEVRINLAQIGQREREKKSSTAAIQKH